MLNLISIKRPAKCLLILFMFIYLGIGSVTPAAAAEEQSANTAISLEQAIDKALASSDDLKKADKEVDIAAANRDYKGTQLGTNGSDISQDTSWIALLSADVTWQQSKKSLTTQEEAVVISTCNKYWAVLKAQQKLELAEIGMKYTAQLLQNAQVGKNVGTISDIGLLAVKTQYQTAQATLASAKNDLDTAYLSFNQQVGLQLADKPILSDTVTYELSKIENLDSEVSRVLANSPTVWTKEQAITLLKYQQDTALYSANYSPYKVRELEMEQTKLDLTSMKKLTEQNTRTMYYQILTIENNYAKAQESLKVLEENLRISKIKYDAGMATLTEVASDEKALADARSSLFDLVCSHEYAKLVFEKPWAAS